MTGPEPYMDLVSSVVHAGKRVRVLGNVPCLQPIEQTFHEFLAAVVRWALGCEWWDEEKAKSVDKQHVVLSWAADWEDFTKSHTDEEHADKGRPSFSADAPGSLWALITFGYDLYCLYETSAVPTRLVKRLRNRGQFQGARYEVAVAAIMKRAGFDLQFLDDATTTDKHSEFIATDRLGNEQLAVEAKSRHRKGVLHTTGEFEYDGDWKGISRLVRDALEKTSSDLPLVVFVDVNLPFTPGTDPSEKPWFVDLRNAMDATGTPSESSPDGFALLFATCFSDHFAGIEENAPPGEWGVVVPKHATVPLQNLAARDRIIETVGRYGRIPDDV
ncbi:MAG: hypothetical protein JXA57_14400 [Armatimonadetes bacterium]|nr:hypothetical protein [Armatimonadota bacterium]